MAHVLKRNTHKRHQPMKESERSVFMCFIFVCVHALRQCLESYLCFLLEKTAKQLLFSIFFLAFSQAQRKTFVEALGACLDFPQSLVFTFAQGQQQHLKNLQFHKLKQTNKQAKHVRLADSRTSRQGATAFVPRSRSYEAHCLMPNDGHIAAPFWALAQHLLFL